MSQSSADSPKLRKHTRCSGQRRTGAGAVVIHLPHQGIDGVELQFVADEGDEGDIERRAVKIALEIEQEDLQQRRAIVEGRTATEAGDAVEALGTTASSTASMRCGSAAAPSALTPSPASAAARPSTMVRPCWKCFCSTSRAISMA